MGREVSAVAQVAAAAHHRQVDAGTAARHFDGQDIDILVRRRQAAGVHRLLVQHPRQRTDAVAQGRRLLEFQRFGVHHHQRLQVVDDLLRFTQQEALCIGHIARVVGRCDEAHTRARAALNLVQQAGPGAVVVNRVFAGAQAKHLLHQLDRLLHRPGVRVGPEVAVLAVHRAAEVRHAREGVRDDLQVRVALVVPEQDVEARGQRLDEVVLQQQRFGLGAHHGGFQPHDAVDHVADARAVQVAPQVAADTLLQIACLADVEHGALGVDPAIDTGQGRQCGDLGQQLVARRGVGVDTGIGAGIGAGIGIGAGVGVVA